MRCPLYHKYVVDLSTSRAELIIILSALQSAIYPNLKNIKNQNNTLTWKLENWKK